MGGMTKEDKALLQFWKKTRPKTTSSKWRVGSQVKLKGTKLQGKILEVRQGHKTTVFSSTGVGKPIKVSGLGSVLSIAVKTSDGRLHFGNPKDLKRLKR